jgi:hypothetical protein
MKKLSVVSTLPGSKRIASAKHCPLESRLITAGDWGLTEKIWECGVGKSLVTFKSRVYEVSVLSFR